MSDPSAQGVPRIQTSATQSRAHTLFGIGSGNAMEWFDWGVYTTFTPFFASQFFHSGDAVSDVLSTLVVFAVGFLIMTMCHAVDYIYFMTGLKAARIYAEYGTLGSPAEVEDIISASFQLDNGAVGNLCGSSIMRGFPQAEERIWPYHPDSISRAFRACSSSVAE